MIRYFLIVGALIGFCWYSVETYYDSKVIAVVTEATEAEIAGDHQKSASLLAHAKNKFGRNCIDTLIDHIGKPNAPVLEKQFCQRLLYQLSMEYSRGTDNSSASIALLTALDKDFGIDYELLDFVSAVKLSESSDPWDRLAAVKALGFLNKKDGLRRITVLLSDPYWLIRVEALQAILKIGDNSLLSKVVEMIGDPVLEVAAEAADVGTKMSAGSYSAALFKGLELLSERDFPAAARAYGQMNNSKVYSILKDKMTSLDSNVSVAASAALVRLGDKDGLDFIKKAIVSGDSEKRRHSAASLSGFDNDEVLNLLMVAASDSDVAVRAASIASLGHCKGPRVFPVIKASLTDQEKNVQIAAITAIGETGMLDAGEAIYSFLKNSDTVVVKATVDALVKLQDNGAIPHLEDLMNSDFRECRLLARDGLKRLSLKDY